MIKSKIIKSKIIYGCESRGDGHSPYLTRWTLLETKRGSLYLHQFHRSDGLELHDHPWPFWSLVIWPGYWEVTPGAHGMQDYQRRWPFLPVYRSAEWKHRVQLLKKRCPSCAATGQASYGIGCVRCAGRGFWERGCWTVIWVGPKVREWGFFTKRGWQNWREYFRERGC